jgi:transcriptional regulator with PAS, ATPase and Fis domain
MEKAVGLKKSQAEIAAAKQNLELGTQTLDLNKFKLTKAKTDQAFDEKFQGALKDVMQESKDTLDKIRTTAETSGMKGLVDTFGSQLKTAFKHDISLVGNSIIVKDNDGKTLHTINSTAEAVSLLEGAAKEQFNKSLSDKMVTSGLFRNPEELNSFVKNQREYNVSMMNAVSSRMQAEASQATGQLARDKFVKMSDAELNELRAKTEGHQADAAWRNAAAASMSEKPKNWELVGADSDGVPISHNKNDNTFARSDGAAIKNYDFFKKFTGIGY